MNRHATASDLYEMAIDIKQLETMDDDAFERQMRHELILPPSRETKALNRLWKDIQMHEPRTEQAEAYAAGRESPLIITGQGDYARGYTPRPVSLSSVFAVVGLVAILTTVLVVLAII